MKRITPLLVAAMLFGTLATNTGCVVRTRDNHHYNNGRRGPPPRSDHDHRRDKDRCRWERC